MNNTWQIILSAFTAFAITAGGSLTVIIGSQPSGTNALNKTAWVLSVVLGTVSAAKDIRLRLQLPVVPPAAVSDATIKTTTP